jgi:hypothetical protein
MSNKLLNAAGIGLALIGAAALPLQAGAHEHQAPAPSAAVESGSDARVVRDAVSGILRAPTAEESAALDQQKAARARNFRAAPQPTLQRFHANGAQGARLTDEFMSTSVAVIKADGTLDKQCFESKEAADAAVQTSGATSTLKLETE